MSRARAALNPEHETRMVRGAKSVPMPVNPGRSKAPGKLGRHRWFCGGLIHEGLVSPRRHVIGIQLMPQSRPIGDVVEAVAGV